MREAEPGEIFEDRALVFRPRALPIVILDAQQHLAVAIARGAPDVQGVDDVAEVQIAGRRRREACQHVQIRMQVQHCRSAEATARGRRRRRSIAGFDRSGRSRPSSRHGIGV